MKKFFTMTMLLTAILSFDDVNAQSISEAICENYQLRMNKVILVYRESGVPIQTSKEHWNGEKNLDLLLFLRKLTEEIYKNPDAGKQYLTSGQFFDKCVKIHRGY